MSIVKTIKTLERRYGKVKSIVAEDTWFVATAMVFMANQLEKMIELSEDIKRGKELKPGPEYRPIFWKFYWRTD